uniref:Uncharacterized protein n=1 Tax=Clastoptera arizonana TaxID=38151 RepID=A0A1B6C789_9HEMI
MEEVSQSNNLCNENQSYNDISVYNQIQNAVLIMEEECLQLKVEEEDQQKHLIELKEKVETQKQNRIKIQMTAEDYRIKIKTEALYRNTYFNKLKELYQMIDELQENLDCLADKLNVYSQFKERRDNVQNHLKHIITELNSETNKANVECSLNLENIQSRIFEKEKEIIKHRELLIQIDSEYNKEIQILQTRLSEQELDYNKTRINIDMNVAVDNEKKILLNEFMKEKMSLGQQLEEENVETNAKENELQIIYNDVNKEFMEKKKQIETQDKNIETLYKQVLLEKENLNSLEVGLAEQIKINKDISEDLDKLTEKVLENENIYSNLYKRRNELSNFDEEQLLILKFQNTSLDESLKFIEEDNSSLVNKNEEFLSETKNVSNKLETLKGDKSYYQTMNDMLKNNNLKLSEEIKEFNNNTILWKKQSEDCLSNLTLEEEEMNKECEIISNEIEEVNRRNLIQMEYADDCIKSLDNINLEILNKTKQLQELENKSKIQNEEHEMNMFMYDREEAGIQEEITNIYQQLDEQSCVEENIIKMKTKLEDDYNKTRFELQSIKEENLKKINGERESFDQLKVQTNTRLQVNASNIGQTQSKLDNIVREIGDFEKDINDAKSYIINNGKKQRSYETVVHNLEKKLRVVAQVTALQSSVTSQKKLPSLKKDVYNFESESDSGASFECPENAPIMIDRKELGITRHLKH